MTWKERQAAINILCRRANRMHERTIYSGLDIQAVSDIEEIDALDKALSALRGPVPDPITGLVPCGCGGKAREKMTKKGCYLQCDSCGERTGYALWSHDNKAMWNIAHGYKGDA